MGLQDLNTCIAAYHCDASGYNATSKKLIDQTVFGNDLDLKVGTAPVFATRDGQQVMDFDLSYYFEGDSPLLSGGSIAIVADYYMNGADGSYYPVRTLSRKALAGNFDAIPNDAVDSDWDSNAFARKAVMHYPSGAPRIFNFDGGAAATGASFSGAGLGLFCGSIDLVAPGFKVATNTETIVTGSMSSGSNAAQTGDVIRIGFLKSSGSVAVANHYSLKRVYFFAGDVFSHPDFSAARAAEIAAWGI